MRLMRHGFYMGFGTEGQELGVRDQGSGGSRDSGTAGRWRFQAFCQAGKHAAEFVTPVLYGYE